MSESQLTHEVCIKMVHLDAHEAKEMTAALSRMRLSMQTNVTSAIDASTVLENDGDNLNDAISTHKDEVKGALKRTSLHLAQLQQVMKREKIYLYFSLILFHLVVFYIIYKRFRIQYFVSVLKRLVPSSSATSATVRNSTNVTSVTSIIDESLITGATYVIEIKNNHNLDATINQISTTDDVATEFPIETNLFEQMISERVFNEQIVNEMSHQVDHNQLVDTNDIIEDATESIVVDDSNSESDMVIGTDGTTQYIQADYNDAINDNIEYETEIDGVVIETELHQEDNEFIIPDTAQDM